MISPVWIPVIYTGLETCEITHFWNLQYVKERDKALGDSNQWSRERFEDVATKKENLEEGRGYWLNR